jgi:DNA-binding response OmpR family regulator
MSIVFSKSPSGPGSDPRPDIDPAPAQKRRQVLLAEDDTEMAELLAWTLRNGGYEVVTAVDGVDLRRRLILGLLSPRAERYDLVISDVRMPGLTGLEVIQDLQELEGFPVTILITAFGDQEIHRQAEEMGIPLLDKPFDTDDLLALVREVLG